MSENDSHNADKFIETFAGIRNLMQRFTQVSVIRTLVLIETGGSTAKLVGEFLAASGVTQIELDHLRDALDFTDEFLETGKFDAGRAIAIEANLIAQHGIFQPILDDLVAAGNIKKNMDNAPLLALIFGSAAYVLDELRGVDAIADDSIRNVRIASLKQSIAPQA